VIAGLNVIAAASKAEAENQLERVQRARIKALLGRGRNWTDAEAEEVLASPAGQSISGMARYTALGTGPEVRDYIDRFAELAQADELITVHPSPNLESRLLSIELLADACGVGRPARIA
jgi:alkanesulfonate monooxygenase SsuD/methylene tetrahydromethanopterin reductase-like flavin-dependent oxidoreductase (luciferase family)